MPVVLFGVSLGTGKLDLCRIYDDDEIACILMRREIRTVFPAQKLSGM